MRLTLRLIGILLIISAVVLVHELGHAYEAYRAGVPVHTVSIGFGFGFLPSFSFALERFPGTTFQIAPVLFGGYAELDAEALAAAPKHVQIAIALGGIKAGMVSMVPLYLAIVSATGAWSRRRVRVLCVLALLAAVMVWAPATIGAVLVLVSGVLGLGYIFLVSKGKGAAGPVGVVRDLYTRSGTFTEAAWALVYLTIALATTNMLPIYPLDGGQIAATLMEMLGGEGVAQVYRPVSSAMLFAALFLLMYKDIMRR